MTASNDARLGLPLTGLVVALTVLKAGNVVASKIVVNDIDPFSATFYRSLLAVVFVVLIGAMLRRAPVAPWRLGWAGGLAAVLFTANVTLFYMGTALTDASRVVLIVNLQPVVVALIAPALFPSEMLTVRKVVGFACALAGVGCIVGLEALFGQGMRTGDLLTFGAMLLWATGTVVEKRALEQLPVKRAAISIVVWNLACLTGALLVGMLITGWRPAPAVGPSATYALAYLVTFGSVMFLALRWVLQRAPVTLVTSFNFLLPLWGVVGSVLLLGETLTLELAAGMVLVTLGIALVNRPANTRQPVPVPVPAD